MSEQPPPNSNRSGQPEVNENTKKPVRQIDLIDHGGHTAKTRSAAMQAANKKLPKRRQMVAELLEAAGPSGLTRLEISDRLSIPYSGVPRLVTELIDAGVVHDTAKKRPTRYGKNAAVVAFGPLAMEAGSERAAG